jgi:hypothetical protein
MLSMVNAGWFTGDNIPLVLATAFAFGGTAQFAAGLMEMPRGNSFGFLAFCSYGAFWWAFALFVEFFSAKVSPDFVGWWLVLWGAFTFFMWVASLALNRAVQFIFLALWITFLLLGLSEWTGMSLLHRAGGYMGLVTAVLAFYAAAAEVINETHGREVLPLGAPVPRAPVLHQPV